MKQNTNKCYRLRVSFHIMPVEGAGALRLACA